MYSGMKRWRHFVVRANEAIPASNGIDAIEKTMVNRTGKDGCEQEVSGSSQCPPKLINTIGDTSNNRVPTISEPMDPTWRKRRSAVLGPALAFGGRGTAADVEVGGGRVDVVSSISKDSTSNSSTLSGIDAERRAGPCRSPRMSGGSPDVLRPDAALVKDGGDALEADRVGGLASGAGKSLLFGFD